MINKNNKKKKNNNKNNHWPFLTVYPFRSLVPIPNPVLFIAIVTIHYLLLYSYSTRKTTNANKLGRGHTWGDK